MKSWGGGQVNGQGGGSVSETCRTAVNWGENNVSKKLTRVMLIFSVDIGSKYLQFQIATSIFSPGKKSSFP